MTTNTKPEPSLLDADRSSAAGSVAPAGPRPAAKYAAVAVAAVVLAGGGFTAGMQYQKGQTTTAAGAMGGAPGQGGFGGRMARAGGFGTVTAVSSTSLTINETRAGTTKTYTINSSTQILNQGNAGTISDLATGDRVMVQTSSSTSTTATVIEVGGGGGMAPGGGGAAAGTQSTN